MPWPWQRGEAAVATGEPVSAPTDVALGDSVDLNRVNRDMAREYVRSIYLWRAVDLIGSLAASVPLIIAKESEESQLTAAEMAVKKLLAYPNPQWSGPALQYFVAASIAVTNKAFILRVRGNGGVPLELWPLQPDMVTVMYVPGEQMIQSFVVVNGGMQQRTYPVDPRTGDSDIIYIRRPALNEFADKSPAAIAAAPAEVFTRVLQRSYDILRNSSNITGMLSTESELAKNAVAEIKDRIMQFRSGRSESGGTLVTANAKWNLTRLSEDPAAALSVEIKDSLVRDICAIFGVPPQLMGVSGQDTYNNIALARVGFVNDTILPNYINFYVAELNHAMMRNGAQIRVDSEHIPALMSARLQLVEIAKSASFLSVNEQRAILGYPPVDDDFADTPGTIVDWALKRMAMEAQGGIPGGVGGILAEEPT